MTIEKYRFDFFFLSNGWMLLATRPIASQTDHLRVGNVGVVGGEDVGSRSTNISVLVLLRTLDTSNVKLPVVECQRRSISFRIRFTVSSPPPPHLFLKPTKIF